MVYILLADGFEEAEAVVPADLLRRAGVEAALVGVTGAIVEGGHGISVACDLTLEQLERDNMEMLILPGGMGGVEGILASSAALKEVEQAAKQGCWIAAICAAPTILAKLGLIDKRRAVCYPGLECQLGSAEVQTGCRVVQDGRIITGEGPGSAFDFGLALVEALKGKETAQQVRDEIHYHG